jgi:hypothetical protein
MQRMSKKILFYTLLFNIYLLALFYHMDRIFKILIWLDDTCLLITNNFSVTLELCMYKQSICSQFLNLVIM